MSEDAIKESFALNTGYYHNEPQLAPVLCDCNGTLRPDMEGLHARYGIKKDGIDMLAPDRVL